MKRHLTILIFPALAAFLMIGSISAHTAATASSPSADEPIGDFNFDGYRDAEDINIMTQYADLVEGFVPQGEEHMFDLDLSGRVDLYDIVEWLGLGTLPRNGNGNGGTVMGDADLDGDVDREDLHILMESMTNGSIGRGIYTLGDFDGNNEYDWADLVIWGRAAGIGQ